MLRWTLFGVLGLAAAVGLVALAGLALPQGHRAQRTVLIARPPADVFAILTDFGRYPEWRSDLGAVSVAGAGAVAIVRESSRGGTMTYRVDICEPTARLVMRIADDALPFGGTWTYDLRAVPTGTELTLTEDGEIYNPIFRFLARFVFGHYATIDRVLRDLMLRTS